MTAPDGLTIGEAFVGCGGCGARLEHLGAPCRFCALERQIVALRAEVDALRREKLGIPPH